MRPGRARRPKYVLSTIDKTVSCSIILGVCGYGDASPCPGRTTEWVAAGKCGARWFNELMCWLLPTSGGGSMVVSRERRFGSQRGIDCAEQNFYSNSVVYRTGPLPAKAHAHTKDFQPIVFMKAVGVRAPYPCHRRASTSVTFLTAFAEGDRTALRLASRLRWLKLC